MMKYFIFCFIFTASCTFLGQAPDMPLDTRLHHQMDRIDIQNSLLFSSSKPYNRAILKESLLNVSTDSLNSSYLKNENFLFSDSSEIAISRKPILKHFYRYKPDFYNHLDEEFKLSVNPCYHMGIGGKDLSGQRQFFNTRGAEIKGILNGKIGFYSLILDNQMRNSDYVYSQVSRDGAVIGENFWKQFNGTGFDFFTAKGYLTFKATKNVRVKFGYDKNFIGDGYRSLILSDYSGNYTHLKVTTQVWKIHYTNLFADLTADYVYGKFGAAGNKNFAKKFMTLHHLAFQPLKNVSLGLFESVTVGGDSTGINGLDINYLNPVIFYRAIESNLGSEGNSIVGANFKWNFLKHISLYGQVVVDEFILGKVKEKNGWWGNKFGAQFGLKYINMFRIDGLDIQLENNIVRPFTYSHTQKTSSYSHFNQSLAHPLGANFNERLAILRYQPHPRMFLSTKAFSIQQGLDLNGKNYGSNILSPNVTRVSENGNKLLQGDKSKTTLLMFTANYMLKHNVWLDLDVGIRKQNGQKINTSDKIITLGFRMNLAQRLFEF